MVGIRLLTLCIFCTGIFASCKRGELEKEIRGFVGKEIVFPNTMTSTVNGKDSLIDGFLDDNLKLVVFYDSLACSSCRLSRMAEWQEIINHSRGMRGKFNVVFVFSPLQSKYDELRVSLLSNPIDYPVFIDTRNDFIHLNKFISDNTMLHTFLLDGKNRVISVGNPVKNERLWNLYKKRIIELANK